jgi:UV DNA damage endonuclease
MIRAFRPISLRLIARAPQRASALHLLRAPLYPPIMAKRKRSAVAASPAVDLSHLDGSKIGHTPVPVPSNGAGDAPKPTRRQSARGEKAAITNPDKNPEVLDGVTALRASPDGHEDGPLESHINPDTSGSKANGVSEKPSAKKDMAPPATGKPNGSTGKRKKAGAQHVKVEEEESNGVPKGLAKNAVKAATNDDLAGDPEAEDELEEDEAEFTEALSRPPPVNSEYLPLPWKGRLGYVGTSHLYSV